MTTIVNNPPPSNNSGGGMGMIIGLLLLVGVIILFFVYGLPAIQQMQSGGTQINVPDEIDININQGEE